MVKDLYFVNNFKFNTFILCVSIPLVHYTQHPLVYKINADAISSVHLSKFILEGDLYFAPSETILRIFVSPPDRVGRHIVFPHASVCLSIRHKSCPLNNLKTVKDFQ